MQLSTDTKKRVHNWLRAYAFELNGMPTSVHPIVLPLGSYIVLLGMDFLYLDRTKVNFYDNSIECLDENREQRILQGKKKVTSVRMVINMKEECSHTKGCVLFVVHVSNDKGKHVDDEEVLKRSPFL